MYVLVKKGVVVDGPKNLPKTIKLDDGRWITGFNHLTVRDLKKHGWFPVTAEPATRGTVKGSAVIEENKVTFLAVSIPLEDAVNKTIAEVYQHAKDILDEAVFPYSPAEMVDWADLARETEKYDDDSTVGPLMQAQIDAGGKKASALASTVNAKKNALRTLRAGVVAARDKHVAAIQALADSVECGNYDVSTGWPV